MFLKQLYYSWLRKQEKDHHSLLVWAGRRGTAAGDQDAVQAGLQQSHTAGLQLLGAAEGFGGPATAATDQASYLCHV